MSDRLPIHSKALELFRQGHDLDTARRVATSEQTPREAARESQHAASPPSPNSTEELAGSTTARAPNFRMCGATGATG